MGDIATQQSLALLPNAQALDALARRYPTNYNIAEAEIARYQITHADNALRIWAERAVQGAPRSPEAWGSNSMVLANIAEDIRQGRYYSHLTPAEALSLNRVYELSEAAAQRATQIDPAFGAVWLELATAGMFSGHTTLADHALQVALKRNVSNPEVYTWGLEMYQPKWDDNPAALSRVAHIAASDMGLSPVETITVATELGNSGFPALKVKLLHAFIARQRAYLAAHPDNGGAHWGLGYLLEATGDPNGGLAEFQKAARLLPDSSPMI